MVYVYSNLRIKGQGGRYINPALFDGPKDDATIVITDDPEIVKAYDTKNGIEFRSLHGGTDTKAMAELKVTAEKLGVKFPKNIKFDTLKAKVEEARE